MEITFDQLPAAVSKLYAKLEDIERLLRSKTSPQAETDQWFDLNDLCNYLPDKPTKPTVYGWVHMALIPCHKGQKKLRFLKSEIDTWLKEGRIKTDAELQEAATLHLTRKKR